MTPEIERLLERLQTGWQPVADEIVPAVPQRSLSGWQFAPSFSRPEAVLIGRQETGGDVSTERPTQIGVDPEDLRGSSEIGALRREGFRAARCDR
jgi:hypothetical protein